jgi:hypothetical protein
MTPIQLAALEKFLTHNDFKYQDYDEEFGIVVYIFSMGDWTIKVAYGDECYYCVYNDVTEEAYCEELTQVSEVMIEYDKVYHMTQKLLQT